MKKITNTEPLVVIFGRTNVGKSTLLNCLSERNIALVSDIEGTTRDSNVGLVEWQDAVFRLIDTGGLLEFDFMSANRQEQKKNRRSSDIDTKVQQISLDYLKKADIILFLVDARTGLLPQDKEMALELKKLSASKQIRGKILPVANKADNPRLRKDCIDFNRLGLGEPLTISATTGSGTGDLLDIIVENLDERCARHATRSTQHPSTRLRVGTTIEQSNNQTIESFDTAQDRQLADTIQEKQPITNPPINVAIIGKPNVGKSSLINALLGEQKMIVSPIAHTTREPKDELIEYKGSVIKIVDTAGISRGGQKQAKRIRTKDKLAKLSIEKSLDALGRSHIGLLVIDINEGITHQEAKLLEEITKIRSGLIIIANKWDLIEEADVKKFTEDIYAKLPFATWAPLLFTSALKGGRMSKIFDTILTVNESYHTEISANALSKFLNKIIKKHSPKKAKGTEHPHIYELVQTQTAPPKFKIRIGAKDNIHFSYIRFIENRLREKFGFIGMPLTIYVEKNRSVHGLHDERAANDLVKKKKLELRDKVKKKKK